MLNVQAYLRTPGHSLETLEAEFGVKSRVDSNLNVVCLNYDQLESPSDHPLVRECRGLILDANTWECYCLPFLRFFNLGERYLQDFDWTRFVAYEKLDGTLISIWHHPEHGWQCSTRGVPDASGPVDGTGLTFRKLVELTLKDMGFPTFLSFANRLDPQLTYAFELTAPENRIVVDYRERRLTLLSARIQSTLVEQYPEQFKFQVPYIVQTVPFRSKEELLDAANALAPSEGEGFVLRDIYLRRLKIKGEAYCLANKCRDRVGASRVNQLELILNEHLDDAFGLLPEHIQKSIEMLELDLKILYLSIAAIWKRTKHIEEQKEFAKEVVRYPFSCILFEMRKRPCHPKDVFEGIACRSPKRALEMIDRTTEIILKGGKK